MDFPDFHNSTARYTDTPSPRDAFKESNTMIFLSGYSSVNSFAVITTLLQLPLKALEKAICRIFFPSLSSFSNFSRITPGLLAIDFGISPFRMVS